MMKIVRCVVWCVVSTAVSVVLVCGVAAAAQGQALTKKDVKHLLATASTSSDHMRLATYYRAEAQRLNAKSRDYLVEAASRAKQPTLNESKQGISSLGPAHFRYFGKQYAEEATDAEARAAQQERLAGVKSNAN
jgi:hypothetical protein